MLARRSAEAQGNGGRFPVLAAKYPTRCYYARLRLLTSDAQLCPSYTEFMGFERDHEELRQQRQAPANA